MESLKQKILSEGQAIGTEILRVDSFLNHQIDAEFLYEIGKAFKDRFHDDLISKILTIEASGIAIAVGAASFFGYPPVVFAKKAPPGAKVDNYYVTDAKPYAKGAVSHITLTKKFLSDGDRVLIIDDLLSSGETALALCDLVHQAGARVVGVGAVIDKAFQGGSAMLREKGYRVETLVTIEKIVDGTIIFG